jgi:L1 cell adhesion molecule like protein
MDANGILNVSASEKSTGKSNKITITNDKGRLSQEEIDRMVEEAERYREEDEKIQQRVEAKNGLDGYLFQIKGTLDGIPEDLKTELEAKIKEAQELVDGSTVSKETYDYKKKEVQELYEKAMSKKTPGTEGNGFNMEEMMKNMDPAKMAEMEEMMKGMNTPKEPEYEPNIADVD